VSSATESGFGRLGRGGVGQGQRGLTLVEAVAALALLALLLAVAVPNLLPAAELEARVAGRQVAADAFLARQLAVSTGESYVLEFRPSGGPYTSYAVRREAGPDEPDFPKELPPGVHVTGPERLRFLSSGEADLADAETSVTFAGGGVTVSMQVFRRTGSVRLVPP
jgi:type II secretory pathway pseudopilin PulG